MEIFCKNCQIKVGKIADEKIPVGKRMSVGCPKCGEKISFIKPVDFSSEHPDPKEKSPMNARDIAHPPSQPTASTKNISGYNFNIMDIIRESWDKTTGLKGPIWGASGIVFLALIVFTGIATSISTIIGSGSISAALGIATQLTISIASYPIMAGLMLIGIRRSIDLPINFKMAFSCFGLILPIVISSILTALTTSLGFVLLIIPGIYLSIAYLMVIPLIIDKGMGPWQAMEASRKAIHHHWFKVFGLYFLMGFILLLSSIPMGIGLIWTFPMFIGAGGILYREIFGVSQEAE